MSKFLKILSLIFLPLAAFVFVLALLGGAARKHGKNFFIKEYDEQNIYG